MTGCTVEIMVKVVNQLTLIVITTLTDKVEPIHSFIVHGFAFQYLKRFWQTLVAVYFFGSISKRLFMLFLNGTSTDRFFFRHWFNGVFGWMISEKGYFFNDIVPLFYIRLAEIAELFHIFFCIWKCFQLLP